MVVKGLYPRHRDDALELVRQESASLALLAKGDGVEIMKQQVKAGKAFAVAPGEHADLLEFFLLLAGRVSYDDEAGNVTVLSEGDYFYSHHLQSMVIFKVIDDATLLYVSTQPLFHHLSSTIAELGSIAKQSREKDMYTHDHGDRVRTYSLEIASRLGLTKERIENIGFASLFHDIGKVKVPDEVLKKPGRLDDAEMEYIRRHPDDAVGMVKDTYFAHIADIIQQHHERLDGSGYPRGLQGEEILLEARIIAVADSFDAMTTDRPYRKALSVESSLMELEKMSGKHYDPRVVDTMVCLVKEQTVKL